MLFFIFCSFCFQKSNVGRNLKSIIFKIYKLTDFIFWVWLSRSKNCNTRNYPNSVKSVFLKHYHAFQSVIFQNAFFYLLFFIGFSSHGTLRNNYCTTRIWQKRIQKMFCKRNFIQTRILF